MLIYTLINFNYYNSVAGSKMMKESIDTNCFVDTKQLSSQSISKPDYKVLYDQNRLSVIYYLYILS